MVYLRKFFGVLVVIAVLVFSLQATSFAATKDTTKRMEQNSGTTENQTHKPSFLVKPGMKSESVKIVQKLLLELGYPVGQIDGICGPGTADAIKQFQMTHDLIPDGIVGEVTLAYLHRAEPIANRNMRAISMVASAYSAYDPGNSHYTATGSFLRKGLVAVDPKVIPLGTRLYIPGYGNAIADDIGGAIKGNRIDLAFDSHGEAIQFGRQNITIYIID